MVLFANSRAGMLLWAACLTGCFNPDDSDGVVGTTGNAETQDGGEVSGTGIAGQDEACEDYCTLVGDHCAEAQKQYGGSVQCEAVCAVMSPGDEGAVAGNNLGCRTFHAVNAGEDPVTHCVHAGPAGGGICGGGCESLCTLALALCTGDEQVWPDFESCAADCAQFPPEPEYSSSVPDGDTFACRMHHLTLASLDPRTHCGHVALDSAVCN